MAPRTPRRRSSEKSVTRAEVNTYISPVGLRSTHSDPDPAPYNLHGLAVRLRDRVLEKTLRSQRGPGHRREGEGPREHSQGRPLVPEGHRERAAGLPDPRQ